LTHKLGYTDEICLAYDILSGNDVVIKLERVEGKVRTLGGEFHVYTKLKGGTGIPHVHWFGRESGFDAIVVDRLGQSLEDLFVQCHFKFTIKTVSLLAGQLVRAFDF
jgi:predicted Ser/Thr protein kinase